nr:DUF4163 domain-containing protein [Paenibacillus sp. JCM 10914]
MAQYVPPANIRTLTYTTPGVVIHYPQVSGLANPRAQEAINQRILLQLHEMERMQQQVQTGTNPQTTVTFEIKTNERGILSLVLTNYTYSEHMAHGYTIAKGLTFNIANGHAYALHELFRPGSNYQPCSRPRYSVNSRSVTSLFWKTAMPPCPRTRISISLTKRS